MTRANTVILKAEGLAVFIAALYFYNQIGYSWWLFPMFLLFDLSMVGYLVNKKIGSYSYNLGHSYVFALLMLVVAFESSNTFMTVIGIMWMAHIGFDRAQGYGLKDEKGFTHTHLGRIGVMAKKK